MKESIFTTMTRIARQHQALNLAQGFPDLPVNMQLSDFVAKAVAAGHNQYAPPGGVPALQQQVVKLTEHLTGVTADAATEVTITNGATEAIFAAVAATIQPGDEVLLFAPAYDSYAASISIMGGKPVFINTYAPHFAIDWQEVKQAISAKTKLVVINTPNNPIGKSFTQADFDALAELLDGTKVKLLSDEVYNYLDFKNKKPLSARQHSQLKERTFVSGSLSKLADATGWKVGYCIAPAELTQQLRGIKQWTSFSVATPLQHALAEYLTPAFTDRQKQQYQSRRDVLQQALTDTEYQVLGCEGSYFQVVRYSGSRSSFEVAEDMCKEAKVATIPVAAFYPPKHPDAEQQLLRLCFAKEPEVLKEGAERMKSYLAKL
jgi:methionine aminotransferase